MPQTQDMQQDPLASEYPTRAAARAEAARESAELALPRPRELFVSDVHGEYQTFTQIVRSGMGAVRTAVDQALPHISGEQRASIAALICYPNDKMDTAVASASDEIQWFKDILEQLLEVFRFAASTRSLDAVFDAIDDDVLPFMTDLARASHDQCTELIDQALGCGFERDLVCALAQAIQLLLVGRLHMLGDVYDRGPAPDRIMDMLESYPTVDAQWGNHDIVWMGAALGQRGCIAHVVRNCARYANLDILEDAYGIDLTPLYDFARDTYQDDPCVGYALKGTYDLPEEVLRLNVQVQKAMAIMQFKVEAQLADEYPSFGLEDRKLLHTINRDTGTINIDGVTYEITDMSFPTVTWDDPYRLSAGEELVMTRLEQVFKGSKRLQRHMNFFLEHGSLYKIAGNMLLFHACVPLNDDGSLKSVDLFGETYKGRALFDAVDKHVRAAFHAQSAVEAKRGRDLLWYLWLGQGSPLFAKSKMATFEIYLVADKAARKEVKNAFYTLMDNPDIMAEIFKDFGMDPDVSHMVCGHVPVKIKDGETPIRCSGKVLMIDGGMSSAYRKSTGVGGLVLVNDAHGTSLATLESFTGINAVVQDNEDLHVSYQVIDQATEPLLVADTPEGDALCEHIAHLDALAEAYETGEA